MLVSAQMRLRKYNEDGAYNGPEIQRNRPIVLWTTATALSVLRRLRSSDRHGHRSEIRGMQQVLGIRSQRSNSSAGGFTLEQTYRSAASSENGIVKNREGLADVVRRGLLTCGPRRVDMRATTRTRD